MNTLAGMIAILKANEGVAALVGTRVFFVSRRISRADFPCILVRRIGGTDDIEDESAGRERESLFDLHCYATTQIVADSVWDAARAMTRAGTLSAAGYRATAEVETAGVDVPVEIDGDEVWDCVFGSIRARIEAV